ncbi:MAG TPA: peptidoglycan-binding domain-containing protein [Burkholderiales bacterium]|nr:peptidoglycan-binding domain-containing protein [Burkholderiales bacterium]
MSMRSFVVAAIVALTPFSAVANQDARDQALRDAQTVREAQVRLREHGYAATPQGLKEFQEAKGLELNGKLDAPTLAALGVGEAKD